MDELLSIVDRHLRAAVHDGLGWGSDAYSQRPQVHPMACALYLSGLSILARTTGDELHLRLADETQRLLLAHRAPTGGWGLGFSHRGRSARGAYAITTAMVGRGFAEHFCTTGQDESLQNVQDVAGWLTRELPWSFRESGAGPWYGPQIPDVLPNVASVVAGFLHRAAGLTGDTTLLRPAREAIRFVVGRQEPFGGWTYGGLPDPSANAGLRSPDVIDLLHSSYVIDGLVTAIADGAADSGVRAAAADGLDFIRRWLVRDEGFCIEKVLPVSPDDPANAALLANPRLVSRPLADGRLMLSFPTESRLWGYGAVVAAAARAEAVGLPSARSVAEPALARMAWVHMSETSGRFRYLESDPRAFPRHEAHAFEALCAVIANRVPIRSDRCSSGSVHLAYERLDPQ